MFNINCYIQTKVLVGQNKIKKNVKGYINSTKGVLLDMVVSFVSFTEEVAETDAPRERSNIVLFVLCGLVVTFGAVGVWRMRQKKGNLLLGFAEKQQDRGTRRKMDSTPTTTPNLSSSSLMHRKLKSSA